MLVGGVGADKFVFDFDPGHMGVDTIVDFKHGSDHIQLEVETFTNIGIQGVLNPVHFSIGSAAWTRKLGILHDPGSGYIYADTDGTGPGDPVKFAQGDIVTALRAADFLVFQT